MKIIWNENPLATVVQLDDSDRQTLRAKIKADEPDIDDPDKMATMYEAELSRSHGGDCTCFPASCPKCYAEGLLGVDTIAGLDKHEGAAIAYAFHPLEGGAPNLAEVLESLRDHKPVKGPAWKRFSDDVFQKHVPRWKEEARRAHEWLVAYLERRRDELSTHPGGMVRALRGADAEDSLDPLPLQDPLRLVLLPGAKARPMQGRQVPDLQALQGRSS